MHEDVSIVVARLASDVHVRAMYPGRVKCTLLSISSSFLQEANSTQRHRSPRDPARLVHGGGGGAKASCLPAAHRRQHLQQTCGDGEGRQRTFSPLDVEEARRKAPGGTVVISNEASNSEERQLVRYRIRHRVLQCNQGNFRGNHR
eukprot:753201-Hanusia_phi.AAC.9